MKSRMHEISSLVPDIKHMSGHFIGETFWDNVEESTDGWGILRGAFDDLAIVHEIGNLKEHLYNIFIRTLLDASDVIPTEGKGRSVGMKSIEEELKIPYREMRAKVWEYMMQVLGELWNRLWQDLRTSLEQATQEGRRRP